MQISKLWVVEYSVKQQYFHIEELEDYATNNIYNIVRNISTDYQLLELCKTHDEARAFIERFQAQYNLPIKSGLQV